MLLSHNMLYFFAFHLLDMVEQNLQLKNVLKAVTLNASSIILTFVFALVVLYIYAIFGFLSFRNFFNPDNGFYCENLFLCWVTFVHYAIRSGGGVGDMMNPVLFNQTEYVGRIFYDITFFALVIICLLNIIFGVIIDTFGELRDQKTDTETKMKGECFICSLDQSILQRKGKGFENHVKRDHNMWQYLFYFLYLNQKSETEYTAQESYVNELVKKESIAFFPINQAMVIPSETEVEQLGLIDEKIEKLSVNHKALSQKYETTQKEFQEKLNYLVDTVRVMTQNIEEIKRR